MEILSRGHLLNMINNSIETIVIDSNSHKVDKQTVVFNKRNRLFYRIEWGEINDSGQIHLWYDKSPKVVKLNEFGKWMTNSEQREFLNEVKAHPIKDLIFMYSQIYFNDCKEQMFEYGAKCVSKGKKVKIISNSKDNILNGIMKSIMNKKRQGNSMYIDLTADDLKGIETLSFTSPNDILKKINDCDSIDYLIIDGLLLDINDNYNIAELEKSMSKFDSIAEEKCFKIAFVINEI